MADKDKANLDCLEEDDEFEEFPAEGKCYSIWKMISMAIRPHACVAYVFTLYTKHVFFRVRSRMDW